MRPLSLLILLGALLAFRLAWAAPEDREIRAGINEALRIYRAQGGISGITTAAAQCYEARKGKSEPELQYCFAIDFTALALDNTFIRALGGTPGEDLAREVGRRASDALEELDYDAERIATVIEAWTKAAQAALATAPPPSEKPRKRKHP